MLTPIKEFFFQQAEKNIIERAIVRYSAIIGPHIERLQMGYEERSFSHISIIEMMPQILHVLTRAIDTDVMNGDIKTLCYSLQNYYQYCTIYSVKFLEKLKKYAEDNADYILTAFALYHYGDLQSRLGELDEAMNLYQSAEELYRKERSNLGLANVLKSMGDLLSFI